MKLIDRLLRRAERADDARVVWADPTAYNRETRRRVGIRQARISPFRPEAEVFVPRYVRRNWGKVAGALTRRQRRIRARSERLMVSYGLARARA